MGTHHTVPWRCCCWGSHCFNKANTGKLMRCFPMTGWRPGPWLMNTFSGWQNAAQRKATWRQRYRFMRNCCANTPNQSGHWMPPWGWPTFPRDRKIGHRSLHDCDRWTVCFKSTQRRFWQTIALPKGTFSWGRHFLNSAILPEQWQPSPNCRNSWVFSETGGANGC